MNLFPITSYLLPRREAALAAEAELLDERLVAFLVLALEVVEEVAAVLDLAEQAVTRAVVLVVGLEVSGEGLDLLREDRDLDLAGTRITVVTLELVLDGGLVDVHFRVFFLIFCRPGSQDPALCPDTGHQAPKPLGIRGRDNLLRQSQIKVYFIKNRCA